MLNFEDTPVIISWFIVVTIIPFILRRHKNILTGPFTIYEYIGKAFFINIAQYKENMLVNVVYTDTSMWQWSRPRHVNNNFNINW